MTAAERMALRVIAVLLFGAAIFFGVRYVLNLRDENKALQGTVDQQASTAQATGTIATATGEALDGKTRVELVVTQAGVQYAQQYEELKREDQSVRDWADGLVPVSVRQLAKCRRLARDGSGSNAVGCQGAGPAEGTTGGSAQP